MYVVNPIHGHPGRGKEKRVERLIGPIISHETMHHVIQKVSADQGPKPYSSSVAFDKFNFRKGKPHDLRHNWYGGQDLKLRRRQIGDNILELAAGLNW